MKFLLISLLTLSSLSAMADGYYGRFWRGEAKTNYPELRNYCDDRHSDCFLELVNRWLIPATPSYAAEKALRAYAPVLLPNGLSAKYHDEIALILYQSEDMYRELRSNTDNIEGSTYGPIHGDIFEMGEKGTKESSRSLVPKIFTKEVTLEGELAEVSYDILGERNDLINAEGSFKLFERGELDKEEFRGRVEQYIAKIKLIKESVKLVGAYALVTEDYFMLYLFTDGILTVDEADLLGAADGLETTWKTKLKKINSTQVFPLLYERIGYGEGANLIFEPGLKPGVADHYRIHI
jgi:hypothetical protein